jgi:hypothetical protein
MSQTERTVLYKGDVCCEGYAAPAVHSEMTDKILDGEISGKVSTIFIRLTVKIISRELAAILRKEYSENSTWSDHKIQKVHSDFHEKTSRKFILRRPTNYLYI